MDIPWKSNETKPFVTSVGLITSNGPHGHNVMTAQWTYLVSFEPGLIAVCVEGGATLTNIKKTKEFGVSIAAQNQNVLTSLAGHFTGEEIDKIKALKKLGFKFVKAQKINTLLVSGACVQFECKVLKALKPGDHTIFIGEILRAKYDKTKTPLAFQDGMYWKLETNVPKPSHEKKEAMKAVMRQHAKK